MHTPGPSCIGQVRQALEKDPEAVRFPFWDHDVEPPLVCAVRLGCDSGVIQLLIESGADVEAADKWGQTPLVMLMPAAVNPRLPPDFFGLPPLSNVESAELRRRRTRELLLQAGAQDLARQPGADVFQPAFFGQPLLDLLLPPFQ